MIFHFTSAQPSEADSPLRRFMQAGADSISSFLLAQQATYIA